MQAASISDTAIVTEADWLSDLYDDLQGMIFFDDDNPYTWYQVNPKLVATVLKRMGFGEATVDRHTQRMLQDAPHSRTAGPQARQWGVDVAHFTATAKRR